MRGDFIVARSQDSGNNDSIELGPDIEFYFRQFVKDRIKTNNTANQQLLTLKAGSHYLAGTGQPSEDQVILQGTSRFPLGWSLLLSDRNRFDLRWVQEQPFSWRYRNHLALERSFKAKRVSFTPYIAGEIIWVSTGQGWNQNSLETGCHIPDSGSGWSSLPVAASDPRSDSQTAGAQDKFLAPVTAPRQAAFGPPLEVGFPLFRKPRIS